MLNTFIGRKKYITEFEAYLAMATTEDAGELIQGDLIRYSGQSGIGKSTLLRRLSEVCDHKEKPYCWLDIDGLELPSGQDILFELARSSRQFPVARKIVLEQNNQKTNNNDELTLTEQFNYQENTVQTILSTLKTFDPTPNTALTNLLHAGVDFTQGVLKRKAEQVEQDVLRNSELFLLNILKNAGKKRPIIFFDGYEHLYRQNQKISSRIKFTGNTAREWSNKQTPRAQWIESLAIFLQNNGWIVVMAGRTYIDDKNTTMLERFSYAEITEAVELKAQQEKTFANLIKNPASKERLIQLLSQLSFEGNPLWLLIAMNLVENLLAQGDTLEKLQSDPDYLQDCFETKPLDDLEEFGDIEHSSCKLNLLSQLTPDDPSLETQAWMLAIPRVLDENILKLLFGEDAGKITTAYRLVGAFSERGKQYKLHEEIRDLLLAYARSKNLLNTTNTKKIHQQLFECLVCWNDFDLHTLKTQAGKKRSETERLEHNKQNPWMLEASYHGVMRDIFCTRNGVTPTEFWEYLGHSISLSYLVKFRVSTNNLSNKQINDLLTIFKDEKIKFTNIFGEKTSAALSKALATGKALSIYDLSYWQEKLKIATPEAGDYLGLAQAYDTHGFTEDEINTYDELMTRYGESSQSNIKAHILSALSNSVEMLMVLKRYTFALKRLDKVLLQTDHSQQESAIMSFLKWLIYQLSPDLAEMDKMNKSKVVASIQALDDSVVFSWGFSELMPLVDSLKSEKSKQHALCFINYFEQHADKAVLIKLNSSSKCNTSRFK